MDQKEYHVLAKKIIKTNQYLSLGTCSNFSPWVAPVAYFIDPSYNFYYASKMSSVHTKNILKNSSVAFAIFDSHQKEGTGVGVQIKGNAYLVVDKDMETSLQYYHSQFVTPEMFGENAPYRLFKIIPSQVFFYPYSLMDERVAVRL